MKKVIKKRLAAVDIHIVKMRESSGNVQFFTRAVRNDIDSDSFMLVTGLDYSCWQTKDFLKNKTQEEAHSTCMERAWFDASNLARWAGLDSMDDVKLIGLSDEEKANIKEFLSLTF